MNLQQISDRVSHLEQLILEAHPDEKNYLEALRVSYLSPEAAKEWREKKRVEIEGETINNAAERAVAAMGPAIEARANEIITLRVQEMVTAEIAKAKKAIEDAKLTSGTGGGPTERSGV